MERKKVLLMFSGGSDSILSMIRLIKNNYKVLLVNFDNGCSISIGLEVEEALGFENDYGKDKVEYIGKITTVPEFKNNELEIANMPFSEIINNYGDTTISQLRCLNCRSAMYAEAIIYCLNNDIHYIAEGARIDQLFSIEQPIMIKAYKELLKEFNIELLVPVYDINDRILEYNLLINDIDRLGGEAKCILGMPLKEPVPLEQTNTIYNIFEKNIKPRYIKELKKRKGNQQIIYKGKNRFEFY
ncbi:MAG: hypothetical protein VZS44_06705 [Bacilli bacterium]|nr:hypothetical protein [Bacilli bacterium]